MANLIHLNPFRGLSRFDPMFRDWDAIFRHSSLRKTGGGNRIAIT